MNAEQKDTFLTVYMFRESMKTNEHIGTEVILALRQVVAHQPEMDKVNSTIKEAGDFWWKPVH